MSRQGAAQGDLIENPLRKPVNTLAIVPTKSSKITVLARKAYNVLLYIAQEWHRTGSLPGATAEHLAGCGLQFKRPRDRQAAPARDGQHDS